MALEISDNFNRADNPSLGADWNEYSEYGDGIRIFSNQLYCKRQSSSVKSYGMGTFKTILSGGSIILEFSLKLNSTSSNNRVHIIARNKSTENYANCYHIQFNGAEQSSKLSRYKSGTSTLLVTNADLVLSTSEFKKVTWKITDSANKVTHDLYLNDTLIYSYEDTSADRLTSSGYVSIYLYAMNTSSQYKCYVDWFTGGQGVPPAYPTAWLKKGLVSGFHVFLNQYIKSKITGYTPLKLPDGTIF